MENIKTDFLKKKNLRREIKRIQSKTHQLQTYKVKKISLPCYDNKPYITLATTTLAYGHKILIKINCYESFNIQKIVK